MNKKSITNLNIRITTLKSSTRKKKKKKKKIFITLGLANVLIYIAPKADPII